MVELRMRKREMRGGGTNHQEKLGLERILCARQCTIPNTAGTSPNLACNNTNQRSSQPNQASTILDMSYPLISSTSFSTSSTISFILVHNSTIIAEHKVMLFLSISSCPEQELTPNTSLHQVQHTPSTAYTKCIIHPGLIAFQSLSCLRVDPWM